MAPKKNRHKKNAPDPSSPSSAEQHPEPVSSSSSPPQAAADLITIRFQLLYSEIFRDIALSELPSDAKARHLPLHTGVIDLCRLLLKYHGVNINQHFGVQFLPQVGENIAASSWSKMSGASIMLHPISEAQVPLYKQAQHLQYMRIPTPGLTDAPLYKQALHLQSMSVEEQVNSLLKVVDGREKEDEEHHVTMEEKDGGVERINLVLQVQELERLYTVTKKENQERMEELAREVEEFRSVVEELRERERERSELSSKENTTSAAAKTQDMILFESGLFGHEELDESWTPARASRKQKSSSIVARCERCARPL